MNDGRGSLRVYPVCMLAHLLVQNANANANAAHTEIYDQGKVSTAQG